MKRPRSYGDGLDEDAAGEKGPPRDWGRRDQDGDRPSPRRRFYPKMEFGGVGRKGSSSSSCDRTPEVDREPLPRSLSRKRFEYEPEAFDRRKPGGGADRYRDGGDRAVQSSSPRVPYCSDRLHRSDSFSPSSRRDYPKGFRSERDKPRREEISSSSWRRSTSGKDASSDDVRSAAPSSRGHRIPSDNPGKTTPKSSSGGEPLLSLPGSKKPREERKEICSISEREEGELEPDAEPSQPVASHGAGEAAASADTGKIELERKPSGDVEPFAEREAASQTKEEDDDIGAGTGTPSETETMAAQPDDKRDESDEKEAGKEGTSECAMETEKPVPADSEDRCSNPPEARKEEGEGEEEEGSKNVQSSAEQQENPSLPGEKELERKTEMEESSREEKPETEEKMEISTEAMDAPPAKGSEEKDEAERRADVHSEKDSRLDPEARPEEVERAFPAVAAETPLPLFDTARAADEDIPLAGKALKFMAEKSDLYKGKGLAVSASNGAISLDDAMEGPSSRGFDLFSPSCASRSEKGTNGAANHAPERLDLSLSLPGASSSSLPPHLRSRPSSLLSISDGFATSASFSGSQRTVHNPSCSLTQNSTDNFENSVGSRPLFKPVDQNPAGGVWQGIPSNSSSKLESFAVPFFQRAEANGKKSAHHRAPLLANGRPPAKSEDHHQPSHSGKIEVKKERNSSSSGSGIVEQVLSRIVSEPVDSASRMLQEMADQSVSHLKEAVAAMVADREKQAAISPLREALQRRSDLNLESLCKLNSSLLEILLILKTGLPGFARRGKSLPPSELAEIFLNLRCRNLQCRSLVPVDDCDCKVCSQRKGFCSACMCLVCGEFDSASNTCGWVGCDVCLHWCHTDCALRRSHIRNGHGGGEKEMQFLCVACGHPSEMFGFVKEVFKTCAMGWRPEILARELEFIRRIFASSEDPKGARLHAMAAQQLLDLQRNAGSEEVVRRILGFLSETESPGGGSATTARPPFPPHEPLATNAESSRELVLAIREPETSPAGGGGGGRGIPRSPGNQAVPDELDGVVKFKRAEAEMYQSRADDARREAEGLKRIAAAKIGKIEEEFSRRLARLRLAEAEERRRQKLQELQSLERVQREFLNLKTRMEADVRELLLKMDAAQRNAGR